MSDDSDNLRVQIMILNAETKLQIEQESQKCTGCKVCMKNCPMLGAYCSDPKQLLQNLNLEGFNHTSKEALQMPFSCTLCGSCDHVCPHGVELSSVFYNMKKDIVAQIGFPQSFGKNALEFHQKNSFSKVFTTQVKPNKVKSRKIFFPGCSPSSHNPELIKRIYNHLNSHDELDIMLKCCGNPTKSIGNHKQYTLFNDLLGSDFETLGVEEIVVLCMNCYNTLTKSYPHIKVTTIWEELLKYGLPDHNEESYKNIDITFALHDPCPTRHHKITHIAVRQVTEQMELKIDEFKFSKEKTVCCGSGAMLGLVHPTLSKQHKVKRSNQVQNEHILTYCQECVESLKQGDKKTIHLLDLVFPNNDVKQWNQRTKPVLKKWINRRKMKKISDGLRIEYLKKTT